MSRIEVNDDSIEIGSSAGIRAFRAARLTAQTSISLAHRHETVIYTASRDAQHIRDLLPTM